MTHKVFLNEVHIYDGESEAEALACWALAIRIIGVTSANARIIRHAGDSIAREEFYRFGMLKSENMLGFSASEETATKERIH